MSEEKPKEDDIQKIAQTLQKTMEQLIKQAKNPENEWKNINTPFTQKLEEKKTDYVMKPNDSAIKTKIEVFQSKTFLDDFFLTHLSLSLLQFHCS